MQSDTIIYQFDCLIQVDFTYYSWLDDHALQGKENPAKGVENHVPTIETATDKTT